MYDCARKSNYWLDQWQGGKLGTGIRVQTFPRALPSPNDVPVLLLNQPNHNETGTHGKYKFGHLREDKATGAEMRPAMFFLGSLLETRWSAFDRNYCLYTTTWEISAI